MPRRLQQALEPKKILEQHAINSTLPSLQETFGFRTKAKYDVEKNQFVVGKTNNPLGRQFIRAIARNPDLARKLVSKARKIYDGSIKKLVISEFSDQIGVLRQSEAGKPLLSYD